MSQRLNDAVRQVELNLEREGFQQVRIKFWVSEGLDSFACEIYNFAYSGTGKNKTEALRAMAKTIKEKFTNAHDTIDPMANAEIYLRDV